MAKPLFDRPRLIATVAGIVLALAGGALALFAPGAPVFIPSVPGVAADAPALRYLFALPDAGDPPLLRPVGVAVGGGRVYVADSEAGVVRSFSTAGPDAGDIGAGVLKVPTYVAKDPDSGTLLVSDRELGAVMRFDPDGTLLGEVKPSDEPTAAWQPLGVAADGKGAIAVTDASARHRVLVMDEEGDVSLIIGGAASVGSVGDVVVSLDFPNSVAFSGDEIWVGDSNNRRVLVFDRSGDLLRAIPVVGVARGLAFITDDEGAFRHAAVVDAISSEIAFVDDKGVEAARFGGPGAAPGLLAFPNDIAYEAGTRRLYVADTGNARVQVWEVIPSEEIAEAERELAGPLFSAMRLAGLGLAAVGIVLAAVVLWPRKYG